MAKIRKLYRNKRYEKYMKELWVGKTWRKLKDFFSNYIQERKKKKVFSKTQNNIEIYRNTKKNKKNQKKYHIRESKTRVGKLGEDEGKLVIKDKGHCLQKCFGEL